MDVLIIVGKILFVLFFFGLCIFIHELGHLLVALWRGLHVERFSIGFGKKIWGIKYKGVEYVVSILPFGGYVALPQLEPSEEPKTSDGKPLPPAAPGNRALTALSGPVFNVLFGFFLALFITWFGIYRAAPAEDVKVIEVPKESAEYEAGLRPGDVIYQVNGKSFDGGWEEVSQRIVLSVGDVTLSVEKPDGTEEEIAYTPAPNPEVEGLGFPFFRVQTPMVLQQVFPGSPAAKAGLKPHDRIVAVNGEKIENTDAFIDTVKESGGAPLDLLVERNGQEVLVEDLQADSVEVDGAEVYRIGVQFGAFVLVHPSPWAQFVEVFTRTRDTLTSLFAKDSLVKPRHMSGPVGIIQIIWLKLAHGGFREGLSFIILISFSLAFFNLLPVPVLDGGHIVFALVEMVIGRRIPTRLAHAIQTAFAVLLIGFMLYVTFFDVKRSIRIWQLQRPRETEESEPATQDVEATENAPALPEESGNTVEE